MDKMSSFSDKTRISRKNLYDSHLEKLMKHKKSKTMAERI